MAGRVQKGGNKKGRCVAGKGEGESTTRESYEREPSKSARVGLCLAYCMRAIWTRTAFGSVAHVTRITVKWPDIVRVVTLHLTQNGDNLPGHALNHSRHVLPLPSPLRGIHLLSSRQSTRLVPILKPLGW
jgi:hypothetical protein